MLNGVQIIIENLPGVELFAVGAMFADVEQMLESRGIEGNARAQGSNCIAAGESPGFSERNERVTEERSECGKRTQHDFPKLLVVAGSGENALAQENRFLAQFVLQLSAMQVHGDFEIA